MTVPGDAQPELAARRKELEAEFDSKLRDLKAQHRRQADHLAEDRASWEQHRREQQRELADRAEKVRRQEDNHKRDAEALRVARAELEATKADLAQHRVLRAEVQQAAQVGSASQQRVQAAQSLLATFSFVAVASVAGVLLLLLLGEQTVALGVAAVALVAALGLEWRRRRLRSPELKRD